MQIATEITSLTLNSSIIIVGKFTISRCFRAHLNGLYNRWLTGSISSVENKSKQSKAIGFCILMISQLLSLSRNLHSLIICRRSRLFAGTALASPLFPPPLVFAPLAPCESHFQTSKLFAIARSAKKKRYLEHVRSASRSAYAFAYAFFQRGRHAEVTIWGCPMCHLQSYMWIGNACYVRNNGTRFETLHSIVKLNDL